MKTIYSTWNVHRLQPVVPVRSKHVHETPLSVRRYQKENVRTPKNHTQKVEGKRGERARVHKEEVADDRGGADGDGVVREAVTTMQRVMHSLFTPQQCSLIRCAMVDEMYTLWPK